MSGAQMHAVWINSCGSGCGTQWAQLGTFQGSVDGHTSYNTTMIYLENGDACGHWSTPGPWALPSPDYAFYITFNGTFYSGSCGYQYYYDYRKGSWTSPPFFTGNLSSPTGVIEVMAENQNSAPFGQDFFGCAPSLSCNDPGYGIHLLQSTPSNWTAWTATPGSIRDYTLKSMQSYWAFETCPAAC